MRAPGPTALGRGVVVQVADDVPGAWRSAPVVVVDEAALADPAAVVADLHAAWSARQPVVIALGVAAERFRAPQTWQVEPWTLHAGFEVWLDRLHFLVWANTYDARDGIEPVWWWARKTARLGAEETSDADGDVVLADGTAAWIDGGPRGPVEVEGTVIHRETVELGRLTPVPAPAPVGAHLAPDQLGAVAHGAGPARVVAPAGSGKTRVLTERVRHLLVHRGYEREGLLAVAYNKKAQVELEERCADIRPRVATLNALGHRLLGSPQLIEEREVRRLLDGLLPRRPKRANTDPMAPYLEGLSAIRLGLRDPAEVEGERDDVPGLADAFPRYRQALRGAVDYDEQVYAAIELLLSDGEARRRAQAGCRHLLVDELQDLTPAHVLLLRLLAAPGFDVFGVGDDDQVIYGHAGADPTFLIDFDRLFPGADDHPLEVNYRCPTAVVDAARTLLSYNHRRVAKEIRPGPDAATRADALQVRRHPAESGATEVVAAVEGWLADGAVPVQIAVLTRVNSLLLAPHVALLEAGVAVSSTLPADVLERTGVRAALAYLRLGASPDRLQPEDMLEVLRRPSRGLPRWIAKWLQRPMSIKELRHIGDRIEDPKVGAKVGSLADDVEAVADIVASGTTLQALTVVADDVGLGGAMSLLDTSKGGQSGSQLDDLDALSQVASLHSDPRSFETWLRGVLAQRSTAVDDGKRVTLSTVHRVKGMEWDRVIVFGVSGGLMPHRLAQDVEEERRVLHVAITRGRRHVLLLADAARPSPFLAELDGSAPRRPARAAAVAAKEPTPGGGRKRVTLADLPPEALAAEEALRAWRTERARADGVPAFIVASNDVLRDIAVRRPTSLEELATVKGIGPTKLDLYGDGILAVLDTVR